MYNLQILHKNIQDTKWYDFYKMLEHLKHQVNRWILKPKVDT